MVSRVEGQASYMVENANTAHFKPLISYYASSRALLTFVHFSQEVNPRRPRKVLCSVQQVVSAMTKPRLTAPTLFFRVMWLRYCCPTSANCSRCNGLSCCAVHLGTYCAGHGVTFRLPVYSGQRSHTVIQIVCHTMICTMHSTVIITADQMGRHLHTMQ